MPHPRVHHSIQRDHPIDNILGDTQRGVTTHSRLVGFCEYYSFLDVAKQGEECFEGPRWGDCHARGAKQLHQE